MFTKLTIGQIAFLIIVPIIIFLVIFLTIFFVVRKKKAVSNYKYFDYKKVYKIVLDNDYYLINNFIFKIDDTHYSCVDHVLFANKYIYLINDYYYDGDIDGKENDISVILIRKNGKKQYEDNPLLNSKKIINRLSLSTGLDASLLIGVCLVNNDCHSAVESKSKNCYIIQVNKLKELIKAIESRPVNDINKKQLDSAVKAIDKLNKRNTKNAKK